MIKRARKGDDMALSKLVRRVSSGEVLTSSKATVPDARVLGDNPLGLLAVSVVDIPQAVLGEAKALQRGLWADSTTVRVATVQENDVTFPAAEAADDKLLTQLLHKDNASSRVLEAAIIEFVRRMVSEGGDISSGDAHQHWHNAVDAT